MLKHWAENRTQNSWEYVAIPTNKDTQSTSLEAPGGLSQVLIRSVMAPLELVS